MNLVVAVEEVLGSETVEVPLTQEGIQACKTRLQSKAVIDKQLSGAQQENTDPSSVVGTTTSKAVVAKR